MITMKIDRRNYRHWIIFFRSSGYAAAALSSRPFKSRKTKTAVLYGHKLNGNLKAFADFYERESIKDFELFYATLDPDYYKELAAAETPVPVLNLNKFTDSVKIAKSDAIITSHGMPTHKIYRKLTRVKFINVWHGIGFKGHSHKAFTFTKGYADNWVSSPTFKKIYRENFGVTSPIHITGYARSDNAVNHNYSVKELRDKYDIPSEYKKIVLVAPTWEQRIAGRGLIPYPVSEGEFFKRLDTTAKKSKSLVVFRTHLNTKHTFDYELDNVRFMPYTEYPVVEDFLYMADLLITDWSSIAFDYLPLRRPVIHMDVKNPYKGGFSLDPKHRFGMVAETLDQLTSAMTEYLAEPKKFFAGHEAKMKAAAAAAYGDTLDGKSAQRYYERLLKLLAK